MIWDAETWSEVQYFTSYMKYHMNPSYTDTNLKLKVIENNSYFVLDVLISKMYCKHLCRKWCIVYTVFWTVDNRLLKEDCLPLCWGNTKIRCLWLLFRMKLIVNCVFWIFIPSKILFQNSVNKSETNTFS